MTRETSQTCAEKIAELEPQLRTLVEQGAPDDEVLAVQNAIHAAKVRIPILLELEEKAAYEDRVRKQREITPAAEAAIKAASLDVVFGDLFAAVDAAIATIGSALKSLPERRKAFDDASKEAYDLSRQAYIPWQAPRADAQGLASALRERIASGMRALELPFDPSGTMPPIAFDQRAVARLRPPAHPLHIPESLAYRGVTVDVNGVATPGPVRSAEQIVLDEFEGRTAE